jgi:serine/threonine protein kinase
MPDSFGTTMDLSGPAGEGRQRVQVPPADPVFGDPVGDCLGRLAHYRVLKLMGRGGMGGVYLAHDEGLDRRVALKVLLPEAAAEPGARERFLREARAAAAVKHDNVVTIYHVGQDRGIPFIAMEFLSGTPLDRYLARKGRLTVGQALRVGLETAEGLAAAHALGLVHRDIKPGNLWLEAPKGRVKILDFGIARRVTEDPRAGLTGTGAVVGTPGYMSPEQARGKPLDHRSDLFSLGVVLYQLTTGRSPFEGDSTMAILTALAVDTPPPTRSLNPEVPSEFEAAIHRLLEKDPDARTPSAAAVAAELRALTALVDVPLAQSAESTAVPVATAVPILVTEYQPEASAFEGMAETRTESPSTRVRGDRGRQDGGWGVWAAVGVAVFLALCLIVGTSYALRKPAAPPAEPLPPDPKPATPKPPPAKPAAPAATPEPQDWRDWPNGVNPEFSAAMDRFLACKPLTERELTLLRDSPGKLRLREKRVALGDAGFEQMSGFRWAPEALEFRAIMPNLTDAGFAHVSKFRALQVLAVEESQITDDALKHLAGLQDLEGLGLWGSRLTDEAGPHLAKLRNLISLDLGSTGIGDEGLKHVAGLPQLQELNLGGTKVTDAGLAHLEGRKLPLVVHLSMTKVTRAAAKRLSETLPPGSAIGVGNNSP